ncbi:hypothetical protein [Flagellimonas flava]|uniref:hypothetical protein n=1 Tax=Flagellimonas flava TaxID=570519 RepID=UPI003D65C98B
MELSERNAKILMLDIHQDIEEYANATVEQILDNKEFDFLPYPPNGGLTENEICALKKLENNPDLKSGLRKIIADNTAGVLFNLFNLIDGTGHPKNDDKNEWNDLKLVDEDWNENEEVVDDWLHDKFFASYWDWKDKRTETEWKLDNI